MAFRHFVFTLYRSVPNKNFSLEVEALYIKDNNLIAITMVNRGNHSLSFFEGILPNAYTSRANVSLGSSIDLTSFAIKHICVKDHHEFAHYQKKYENARCLYHKEKSEGKNLDNEIVFIQRYGFTMETDDKPLVSKIVESVSIQVLEPAISEDELKQTDEPQRVNRNFS